ncbi:uncharacterized protein L3040_001632 [Drepanopeziza brunnea f. sp. 'multigermtubi']|uniref:uncharacterized protein n=1 Tax=Drepanopeziza brunnea f. sp. 'multigermtubi' TaxID=698441 RepID=UPI00238EBA9B|nr:hypothetical protein L3040_001632 [Drepanopeziza brunnea f. sp. 'multigermtubi']
MRVCVQACYLYLLRPRLFLLKQVKSRLPCPRTNYIQISLGGSESSSVLPWEFLCVANASLEAVHLPGVYTEAISLCEPIPCVTFLTVPIAAMFRPNLNQDDQESQIVDPDHFDGLDVHQPGSHEDCGSEGPGQPLSHDNVRWVASPEQDSLRSRIEETQNVTLEVDTQADTQVNAEAAHQSNHESMLSRVGETQLAVLEADTQAITQPTNVAVEHDAREAENRVMDGFFDFNTQKEKQSKGAVLDIRPSNLPAIGNSPSTPLFQIQRPIAVDPQDIAADFKMSVASKNKFVISNKNPVVRVQPQSSDTGLHTDSASATTPGSIIDRPTVHALPQAAAKNHQSASKEDGNKSRPSPQEIVIPGPKTSEHTPLQISSNKCLVEDAPPAVSRSTSSRQLIGPSRRVLSNFRVADRTSSDVSDPQENAAVSHDISTATRLPINLQQTPPAAGFPPKTGRHSLNTVRSENMPLPVSQQDNPVRISSTPSSEPGFKSAVPGQRQPPKSDNSIGLPPVIIISRNMAQNTPIFTQKAPWEPVVFPLPQREPLTPLRGRKNPRIISRAHSKNLQRRVPFPEAATPQSNHCHPSEQQRLHSSAQETIVPDSGHLNNSLKDGPVADTSSKHDGPQQIDAQAQTAAAQRIAQDFAQTLQINGSPELWTHRVSTHAEGSEAGFINQLQQLPPQQNFNKTSDQCHIPATSPNGDPRNIADDSENALAGADEAKLNDGHHLEHEPLPAAAIDQQSPVRSGSATTTQPRAQSRVPESDTVLSEASGLHRAPSREYLEARGQSPQSNQGRAINRRACLGETTSQGYFEVGMNPHNASRVMKVTKAVNRQAQGSGAVRPNSLAPKNGTILTGYQNFLKQGVGFEEVIRGYDEQKALIESQQLDITNLQQVQDSSRKQIEALEAQKADLTQKIQKFAGKSSKYKNHINDVVKSQNFLKKEANEILKESSEIRDALTGYIAAQSKKEANLDRMKAAIQEAKKIGATVQTLEAKLSAGIIHREPEALNTQLQKDTDRQLEDHQTVNTQLQKVIDRQLQDLSRERHEKEQLQRQLDSQNAVSERLVEQMKQLPGVVSEQLQQEGAILAKILGAENATHAKINEVTSLINALNSLEPEPPASLIKLIQDLFSRLESREENSEAGHSSFLEANFKALEELKESLRQIRLDKDTEISYTNRIASLENSKDTLSAEKSARDQEILSITQQLEELKREAAEYRNQLSTYNEELSAARAVPKEDPRLKAKIQELESAKNKIEDQLMSANQEASEAKEEANSIRQSFQLKEQQFKALEQRFNDAQKRINNFDEERDKYIATKEQENKATCQELTKKAEVQKATLKLKLESEVKNFEQRCREKESELTTTKEKLQRLQAEYDASVSASANAQKDIAQLTERSMQTLAQMRQLSESNKKISTNISKDLQFIRKESSEIQKMFQTAVGETDRTIEAAAREHREVEAKLRAVALLEIEKDSLKEQNFDLKNKVESLSEALARQTQQDTDASLGIYRSQVTHVQSSPANMHMKGLKPSRPPGINSTAAIATPEETLRQQVRKAELRASYAAVAYSSSASATRTNLTTPQFRERRNQELNGSGSTSQHPSRLRASQSADTPVKRFSDIASSSIDTSPLTEPDLLEHRFGSDDGPDVVTNASGDQSQVTLIKRTVGATKEPNPASAKPLKSAMKRLATQVSGQNRISFTESSIKAQAEMRGTDSSNMLPRQERRPEHFQGAISGSRVGSNATSNHRQQNGAPELPPADRSPIPLMGLRLNFNNKRNASDDATGPARKRRLSTVNRKPSRSVIPDSQ